MATTPRLGITLPANSTNVTTQFFIDRFNEIDAGAETPAAAQAKATAAANALKATTQNKKITTDSGDAMINISSGSLLTALLNQDSRVCTFAASTGVSDLPAGVTTRGMKIFATSTYGWVIAMDYNGNLFTNYHDGPANGWQGWRRTNNNETINLSSGHGYTLQNIPPGIYYYPSSYFPEAAPHPGPEYLGYLEVIKRNDSYKIFKHRVSFDQQEYINSYHNGSLRGWRLTTKSEKVLWSGDARGNFTTTFTLAEPLTNFSYIYFRAQSTAGLWTEERLVRVDSIPDTNSIIWGNTNVGDDAGSNQFSISEMEIVFNVAKSNFKMTRCSRMAFSGVSSASRTDNDITFGLSQIVGIR